MEAEGRKEDKRKIWDETNFVIFFFQKILACSEGRAKVTCSDR